MNEHDSARIEAMLVAEGMVNSGENIIPEVYVINTCCVRENADNKLYGHLGNLKVVKEENPNVKIVVTGCLAQKDGFKVRERAPFVDIVVGTHNVHKIPVHLNSLKSTGPITEIIEPDEAEETVFLSDFSEPLIKSFSSFLTIQQGCNNSCGFCIVPKVRGKEVSREIDDIVKEVEQLACKGVKEVVLLGQNVNSYGRDLSLKMREKDELVRIKPLFAQLLRKVGSISGIKRVRFTSPHPKDLRAETVLAIAETKSVCEQLHLPVQSGSDRVLSAMRRGYSVDKYLERLNFARHEIEDLAVTTDIIVGYPGEREEDFAQTLDLMTEAKFDSAYTFIFSPRDGTLASEQKSDFVDPDTCAQRMERLRVVVERFARIKNKARVGKLEEIMVIGPSKKDKGVLTGRTRQGKLVHFEVHPDKLMLYGSGSELIVEITSSSTHYLRGTVLEELDIVSNQNLSVVAGS